MIQQALTAIVPHKWELQQSDALSVEAEDKETDIQSMLNLKYVTSASLKGG